MDHRALVIGVALCALLAPEGARGQPRSVPMPTQRAAAPYHPPPFRPPVHTLPPRDPAGATPSASPPEEEDPPAPRRPYQAPTNSGKTGWVAAIVGLHLVVGAVLWLRHRRRR